MSSYRYEPIEIAPLHLSDVTDETSRFDKLLAAPSDHSLLIMWTVTCVSTALVVLSCLLVLFAILRKREVRLLPFNCYVVFLVIPDLILATLCFINCLLNLTAGHYYSEWWCRFQAFYHVAGGANTWLNAFIAMEMQRLLVATRNTRDTYVPPNMPMVVLQAVLSYTWAMIISALPAIDRLHMPLEARLQGGAACLPTEYDAESTIFKFAIYLPFAIILPTLYVIYVSVRLWRGGYLDRHGETRELAIYFSRVIVVFYVMWLPAILCFFIVGPWMPLWAWWTGGQWSHLQGFVTAIVITSKPDIREAVKEAVHIVTCGLIHFEHGKAANKDPILVSIQVVNSVGEEKI